MKNIIFLVFIGLMFSCAGGADNGTSSGGSSSGIDGEIVPGYTYVNHTKNKGAKPLTNDYAYFNYYVMDGDSMMFSNRSQTGEVQKVKITDNFDGRNAGQKPLVLALQKMSVGDSLSLYIPRDSLKSNANKLKSDKLTYHLALVDIKDEAAFQADAQLEAAKQQKAMAANQAREAEIAEMVMLRAKEYKKGALDAKIKTTPSGLKYVIHEEGDGNKPSPGQGVSAHYFGALTDGTPFDNSFKRGQLFTFPIGQGRVIRGWDEGFALLSPGAKATLFIPSELGYGPTGSPPSIPPNSELIFYVEFDSVK